MGARVFFKLCFNMFLSWLRGGGISEAVREPNAYRAGGVPPLRASACVHHCATARRLTLSFNLARSLAKLGASVAKLGVHPVKTGKKLTLIVPPKWTFLQGWAQIT